MLEIDTYVSPQWTKQGSNLLHSLHVRQDGRKDVKRRRFILHKNIHDDFQAKKKHYRFECATLKKKLKKQ